MKSFYFLCEGGGGRGDGLEGLEIKEDLINIQAIKNLIQIKESTMAGITKFQKSYI